MWFRVLFNFYILSKFSGKFAEFFEMMKPCPEIRLVSELFKDVSKIPRSIVLWEERKRKCGRRDLGWTAAVCHFNLESPLCVCVCLSLQGLEGEDEGAISMLSDNTAKLTSAVRYCNQDSNI